MTTRTLHILLGLSLAGVVSGQSLELRDGIRREPHMVAYDSARLRLVEVGRQGETREVDGTSELLRPGPGPRVFGRLVHRTGTGRTLAFGAGASLSPETHEYDGVRWRRLSPAVEPSGRIQFAMTYDVARDRVVLFGGAAWPTVVGDTWEWDGTVWSQRGTAGPSPRVDAAFAYDSARGVCVLFGGNPSGAPLLGDTWEWDGVSWQQRAPATAPTPRSDAAMVFDPLRGRSVLYGGFAAGGAQGDVWEFDGVNWQSVSFVGGPGLRYEHDLVFDAGRGEVWIDGGIENAAPATTAWTWNGVRWQLVRTVAPTPPVSVAPGTTAEPVQGGLLHFGGGPLDRAAWRFDNGTWTRTLTATGPSARMEPAMWTDGVHAWMFGGLNPLLGLATAETWRWTGTAWQAPVGGIQPPARAGAAVAYDSARGRAVLFGGAGAGGAALADTWTFDGSTWRQEAPLVAPPARRGHGMAFDPVRGLVVLYGGEDAARLPLDDTWEWDGAGWSQVNVPAPPPGYGAAAMTFDARIARIVMTQARWSGSIVPTPAEVWIHDGMTWLRAPLIDVRVVGFRHSLVREHGGSRVFLVDGGGVLELVLQSSEIGVLGAPCTPAAPRISPRTTPAIGSAEFGIDVTNAPPQSVAVLGVAPMPASLPLAGCTLRVGAPLVTALVATNAAGFGSRRIPLPAAPVLLGTQWHFQALTLDPGAPAGITFSAALRAIVGR